MYVNVKVAVVYLLHHQTSVKRIRIVFIINSLIWSGHKNTEMVIGSYNENKSINPLLLSFAIHCFVLF